MKKQTKNRLFKLLGIGACSFVLGLSACSSNYYYGDHSEETKQYEYVEKHTRKNAIVENDTAFVFDTTLCDSIADYIIDNSTNIGVAPNYNTTIARVGPLTMSGAGNNYVNETFNVTQIRKSTNAGQNQIIFSIGGSTFEYNYVSHTYSFYGTAFDVQEDSVLYVYDEGLYNYLLELYPLPSDDMPQVLTDFMSLLVGGIQSLAVGIAQGVASMASALFLNVDNGSVTGLSTFGGIIAIFAGIALAVGITTRVYLWITRLGKD